MRVLLLTRYSRLGASSRLRSYQYLPYLQSQGIDVTVSPLFDDAYLKRLYTGQKTHWFKIAETYLRRIAEVLRCRQYDLIWMEKELFPWLPSTFEKYLEWFGVPYMVDYDDAIFHRYDAHSNPIVRVFLGHKIDAVMRRAAMVVVGNGYLAERAHLAGARRVKLLPTVIDLRRYSPVKSDHLMRQKRDNVFTIGWIGTPVTAKYLNMIGPALAEVSAKKRVRLAAVGLDTSSLDDVTVDTIPWSEDSEAEQIRSFDVGIMPLPDDLWERGKCGYKLIQYMACGLPVIASPVGVNRQIVEQGETGFLASTESDWCNALIALIDNLELALQLGRSGRERVAKDYCLQVTAPKLFRWMSQIVEKGA